jgi:hypothetical protein
MTEETPGDNVVPEQAADLPSLPARIAQVFFSPAALFDKLKAKPVWMGALLTMMVVSLIINVIIPEELIRQLVMEQLGDNPEPAQIDAALRMAGIFRYVGPIVFTPILAVILAGLVLLIWNLILGGEASFAQTMSVSTHTVAGTRRGWLRVRFPARPQPLQHLGGRRAGNRREQTLPEIIGGIGRLRDPLPLRGLQGGCRPLLAELS